MIRKLLACLASCVYLVLPARSAEIRLKTRVLQTEAAGETGLILRAATEQPKRVATVRWHWLIAVHSLNGPVAEQLAEISRRGATVLSSVPPDGYIVAAPDTMSWEGLNLAYRAPLDPADKLSPLLAPSDILVAEASTVPVKKLLVAHFHSDVRDWEISGILDAEGITPLRNDSLEAADRLLDLTDEEMGRLRLWDELEYLFPAPEPMRNNEVFLTCGGVLSGSYEVAMLATPVGNGWDGAGKGSAALTYTFGPISARLDPAQTRSEIRRAMAQWANVVAVTFSEGADRQASRNLDFMFASGDHGDPYPFLAGSAVLAHSFFPAPPNPEPIAGDVHINEAFTWSIGGQWDVFSVTLHELGHALGIGHTDVPGSVMYPYYQKADGLKQVDIDSMRLIYGPAGTTTPANPVPANPVPAPGLSLSISNPTEGASVTGDTLNFGGALSGAKAGVGVAYRNELNGSAGTCLVNSTATTWACASVPLAVGTNRVTITATQSTLQASATRAVTRVSAALPVVTITDPASARFSTTASQINISGTAAHSDGISGVRWASSTGRSGTATGTTNWTFSAPLDVGANEILVSALSRGGLTGSRSVTIDRTTTTTTNPPANPGTDTVAPRMTIQQPIGTLVITSAPKLTFRGTATDNVGVTKITWTNSAGQQSGSATPTGANPASTSFLFDVNIAVGFNNIQVRAWDAAGNSTLYTTTVRRY